MFKYVDVKKFLERKNNFKINKMLKTLTITAILSTSLVGCGTKKSDIQYQKYSSEELYSFADIDVYINYSNWNEDIKQKEKIFFTYGETMYNAGNIQDDGTFHTQIKNIDGQIYSYYLKKEIDIPKANEDEKIVVNVDYKNRKLEANTEKLELDKTK